MRNVRYVMNGIGLTGIMTSMKAMIGGAGFMIMANGITILENGLSITIGSVLHVENMITRRRDING